MIQIESRRTGFSIWTTDGWSAEASACWLSDGLLLRDLESILEPHRHWKFGFAYECAVCSGLAGDDWSNDELV